MGNVALAADTRGHSWFESTRPNAFPEPNVLSQMKEKELLRAWLPKQWSGDAIEFCLAEITHFYF